MKLNKSTQNTLIIVAGLVILGIIIVNSVNPSYENTISVSGQSTIKAMPDIVGIYFNVDTKGATANEAGDKNSEIVNNLTDAMINLGFGKEDVKTQNYNIYPDYNYQTGKITGYRATHSLRVEVPANQSSRIGAVVDAGLDAGAGIGYLNFELSQENQNKYKTEAMKLAAQDATSKAEGIAQGLDKKLGKLVSVSVNDYGYVPWLAYDASGAGTASVREAAKSITPSEQEISASVTAVFKIR